MKKTLILTLLLSLFTSFSAKAEVQFLPEASENMEDPAATFPRKSVYLPA